MNHARVTDRGRPTPMMRRTAPVSPLRRGGPAVPAPATALARDSEWDDALGADFTKGEADQLEAEGKDPGTCTFC